MNASDIGRLPALHVHEKLSPDHERRARAAWDVLKGFYHCTSWEQFEFHTCSNVNPEFDLEFLEWIADRFQAYRAQHPKVGTFHLKRKLREIQLAYFKTHPVATVIGPDGVLKEIWAAGSNRPASSF
jgi:hypothetical protein